METAKLTNFLYRFDVYILKQEINFMVMFTFLILDLFSSFVKKNQFTDYSPSSLLAETLSQWLFLLHVKTGNISKAHNLIYVDVDKRRSILVTCCLNNLYGCYVSLQTFLYFLIMKKQQKRKKIIQKIISS